MVVPQQLDSCLAEGWWSPGNSSVVVQHWFDDVPMVAQRCFGGDP
jgi:hypothetical protein